MKVRNQSIVASIVAVASTALAASDHQAEAVNEKTLLLPKAQVKMTLRPGKQPSTVTFLAHHNFACR